MSIVLPLAQSWSEALAAVGTVGATGLALILATHQGRKARRSAEALAYARARLVLWTTRAHHDGLTVEIRNAGTTPILDLQLTRAWLAEAPPRPFSQDAQWVSLDRRALLMPDGSVNLKATVAHGFTDWSQVRRADARLSEIRTVPRYVRFRFTDFEGTQWEAGDPNGPVIIRAGLLNPRRPAGNRQASIDLRRIGPPAFNRYYGPKGDEDA